MTQRFATVLCAAVIPSIVACGDARTVDPIDPGEEPGEEQTYDGVVHLLIATPHVDDRAILIEVRGPAAVDSVVAREEMRRVIVRDVGEAATRIALFGSLPATTSISFRVPDESQVGAYSAEVLDAAGPGGALRNELDAYQITIDSIAR